MNRRSFIAGILAGCAAPALVRSQSLMKLWVPPAPALWVGCDLADIRGDMTLITRGEAEAWAREAWVREVLLPLGEQLWGMSVLETQHAAEYQQATNTRLRRLL